ncbi:MAG: DEAD/DEAH box helicase [Thaumarchaeota archaeon]|nr:DEAD/DEAH box helicase [Nitrososphaerota archaeon]
MASRFENHPLIRSGRLEFRSYQVSIAEQCLKENTLVVLPTGLGKTVVALLTLVEFARDVAEKKCLFLSPTRVLVHQHRDFILSNSLLGEEDVEIVTGEEPPELRRIRWGKKVICATPQVVVNDVDNRLLNLEELGLVIFDEVHRAVGDYAYNVLGEQLGSACPACRLVGFTASLPGEMRLVRDILQRMRFSKVEARDESSEEVKPFTQDTEVKWVEVTLPPVMQHIRNRIAAAMSPYAKTLVNAGLLPKSAENKLSFRMILECRKKLGSPRFTPEAAALYSLIRLNHALSILETQSLESFKDFLDRLIERKRGIGLPSLLAQDSVVEAYEAARGALMLGVEHPKIAALKDALDSLKQGEKAMVFASYRHSVEMLCRRLNEAGIKAGYLIGKSGGGFSQQEQVEALEDLRSGRYSALVATQVGEEGLDVSECNLVAFYDNVPSGIRFIQRRGRTGRRAPGKVMIFVAKDTKDEAYYWMGLRRLQQSNRIAHILSNSNSQLNLKSSANQEKLSP